MSRLFLLLPLIASLFAGCEDEYTLTYPSILDEHITFSIDGETQRFTKVKNPYALFDAIHFFDSDGTSNRMDFKRSSEDGETTINLSARRLPLRKTERGVVLTTSEPVPASFTISSLDNMAGSIYCPHIEGRSQVTYQGFIQFDEFIEGEPLKGTFSTDKDADNIAELENGSFEVMVALRYN